MNIPRVDGLSTDPRVLGRHILYGRPYRSPIFWIEVGESFITDPDLIRDTSKKVGLIQKSLLTA